MLAVETISEMRGVVANARAKGKSISFVPTMGALHEGHLTLIDEARRVGEVVVMSVFVNPLQFGPNEDFVKYPRTLDDDARLAEERGVDFLFTPTKEDMYPAHAPVVLIHPGSVGKEWEGAVRPHHFEGVLTVVAKLFNLVCRLLLEKKKQRHLPAADLRTLPRRLCAAAEHPMLAPRRRVAEGATLRGTRARR